MSDPTPLTRDYTLDEVAQALGMSTRWVRDRINLDDAEHIRYGHKIRFTSEQVDKLRASHTKVPAPLESITTGRKKKSA